MSDAVFRSATPEPAPLPSIPLPDAEPNVRGAKEPTHEAVQDLEPIEIFEEGGRADVLLDGLGIDDDLRNLPGEDRRDLDLAKEYLLDILKSRGYTETTGAFRKVLSDVRDRLDIDDYTDPSVALKRITAVAKAWRELTFIKDARERTQAFQKIARIKDPEAMQEALFKEMEARRVWQ